MVTETSTAMLKRSLAANVVAGKASHESMTSMANAFAIGVMLAVQFGNVIGLNDLYAKLHAKDKDGMRRYGIAKLADNFHGEGNGERMVDDASKWKVRPLNVFEFRSTPPAKSPGVHFTIAGLDADSKYHDVETYGVGAVKKLKAMKKALLDAGEDGIRAMEWVNTDEVNRVILPSNELFTKRLTDAITYGAKNGFLSPNDAEKIGRAANLEAKKLTTIRDLAVAAQNAARDAKDSEEADKGGVSVDPAPQTSKRDKPVKSSVGNPASANA